MICQFFLRKSQALAQYPDILADNPQAVFVYFCQNVMKLVIEAESTSAQMLMQ